MTGLTSYYVKIMIITIFILLLVVYEVEQKARDWPLPVQKTIFCDEY
jgi:hypothetical protein